MPLNGVHRNGNTHMGNINVYQARRLLLKLVDEGAVIKTGTSKGLPIHWWLIGADKNQSCLSDGENTH
ncbi:hypothetical protein [Budvicia aquatica]|uniref:FaeA-like protein n=2 Tax=Budvicia aquatica TaxID=82979 RepID=A0A2C6DLH6_9GAMM|nr:hypothetical protein [Budvicia aquatica]PHI29192.1 hypothetical protein CRN84_07585 [Budvicia aquatica]VFS47387.1 Uncharacterised protein [Budvicia aquatica]